MKQDEDTSLEPPKKVPRLSDFPSVPPQPPDKVILYIFQYLDSPDLSTCRYVCKTWYKLSVATLQSRKSMAVSNVENGGEFQNTIPRFPDYTSKVVCEGEPSLHQLPEEMILHIFTFLEPTDLLECGKVCKLWYNISRRSLCPYFRSVLCYDYFFEKHTRPLLFLHNGLVMCRPEHGINIIESFSDILKKVKLTDSNSRQIVEVLGKCTNLKSLEISSIDMEELDLFYTISMSLPKSLDSLNLTEYLDQDTMLLLLSKMFYLRKLTIDINGSFTNGKRLAKILKRLQLRSLDISYTDLPEKRAYTVFLMDILHALSGTLEQLTLRGAPSYVLDFDSLPYLHKLKRLVIDNYSVPISENDCDKILLKMPNLIELDLDIFCKKGDCILRCLKGNPIRKMILRRKFDDDQSLMDTVRCYSASLEELKIPLAAFLTQMVPEFSKLSKCTVYWTEDTLSTLTDDSLQKLLLSIFESMPNVVDFAFENIPSIPDKCLQAMMKHCPRIKTLELPQILPSTDTLLNTRHMSGIRTLMTKCSGSNLAFLLSCKSLHKLSLIYSEFIEDRDVALLIHCLKYLKDLDITGCHKVTGVFIEFISGIKRHSPTLTIHCPNTVYVRREYIPKFIVLTGDYNYVDN